MGLGGDDPDLRRYCAPTASEVGANVHASCGRIPQNVPVGYSWFLSHFEVYVTKLQFRASKGSHHAAMPSRALSEDVVQRGGQIIT